MIDAELARPEGDRFRLGEVDVVGELDLADVLDLVDGLEDAPGPQALGQVGVVPDGILVLGELLAGDPGALHGLGLFELQLRHGRLEPRPARLEFGDLLLQIVADLLELGLLVLQSVRLGDGRVLFLDQPHLLGADQGQGAVRGGPLRHPGAEEILRGVVVEVRLHPLLEVGLHDVQPGNQLLGARLGDPLVLLQILHGQLHVRVARLHVDAIAGKQAFELRDLVLQVADLLHVLDDLA